MKVVWSLILISLICGFPFFAQEEKKEGEEEKNPVCIIKTSEGDIHVELFAKEAPKTVENFIGLAEGTKEFSDSVTGETVKKPFYDGLIFHRVIKNFMIQGGCPKGNGTGDPGYKFEDEINANDLGLDKLKVIENDKPNPLLGIQSQQQWGQMVIRPLVQSMGIKSQEEFQQKQQELQKKLATMTIKDCYQNMGYKYNKNLKSHHPKRGVIAMANSGANTNGSQFFINLIDTPWLAGKHTVFGKVVEGMAVVDRMATAAVGGSAKPVTDIKIVSIRLKK